MSSIFDAHLRAGKLLSGYLLVGSFVSAREIMGRASAELLGKDYLTSPDYHEFADEKFGIDDAREVIRLAALRPVAGGEKVFFLNVNGITIEAANALLKITEEPPAGTHFFLTTTVAERLPATLRSRLVEIFLKTAPNNERVIKFLALTFEKRLAEVKKMAERPKFLTSGASVEIGSTPVVRDRSEVEEFLSGYEAHLVAKLRGGDAGAVAEIERFFKLKELFLMPASYAKAILEGIAIL